MNTDKIYAESIANEYATKNTSKVVALKKRSARLVEGLTLRFFLCVRL